MEFLQNDAIDIILSAEVLFSAVFTVSLFIAVHALLTFTRQSGDLYSRLAQIEADLNVYHVSIPAKLERIRQLREDMAPLRERFQAIQAHHARLQHLERKAIEDDEAREREESEDQEKKIQRQKLGLDRFL